MGHIHVKKFLVIILIIVSGAASVVVPVVALCCLVVTLVGMGLKLPWFRRQMRLGNMSQRTATASSQRAMTASVTNMPSQGVFRRLSFENIPTPGPLPPPPRKDMVRPQSTPVLPPPPPPLPSGVQEKKPQPVPQAAPTTKAKAKPVIVAPPPAKTKAKTAPPTRRNPNARAFSIVSAAMPQVKASPAKGSASSAKGPSSPIEASNPMLQAMGNNDNDDYDEHLSPSNGYAVLPASVSPKPASKKGPKNKKEPKAKNVKNKKDKSPIFAKMSPKVQEPPSPPPPVEIPSITRASRSDDEEDDGNFTFTLPDAPNKVLAQHSFLHMNVGDSDECDA